MSVGDYTIKEPYPHLTAHLIQHLKHQPKHPNNLYELEPFRKRPRFVSQKIELLMVDAAGKIDNQY